jgi:hypothetical protein
MFGSMKSIGLKGAEPRSDIGVVSASDILPEIELAVRLLIVC